jgi:predicted RNA-binding Zn ribbon-like protein
VLTLKLIEEFLNTVDERQFSRHGELHRGGESLTSPAALRPWLSDDSYQPDAEDLRKAVALRTALRENTLDVPLRLTSAGLRSDSGRPWLDAIVETVAESMARGDWKRIKLCAAPDCRWAFYDTSRNGQGRWCDMAVCGNRHKTRTYRERRKDQEA